ncbi:hypothetical protein ScPMuIL_015782 [Solemya velum]
MSSDSSTKSSRTDIFKEKTFCVVVGASRGIGKSIAVNFASKFEQDSFLLLLARDENMLDEVKSEIRSGSPGVTVVSRHFDQSNLDSTVFNSLFSNVLEQEKIKAADFTQAVIVHNAATIGDPTKYVRELTDVDKVKHCYDMNVTGMILLNAAFLQEFTREVVKSRVVINLSAGATLDPYPSWSLYCSAKAARYMFFRVLAVEEPDIRVLNYAPGLVLTDMLREAGESKDPGVRAFFEEMIGGKAISTDSSANKLIEILKKNMFETGAHVNYDEPL